MRNVSIIAISALYSAGSEATENCCIFGSRLENMSFYKNAQQLQVGIHRIWNQHTRVDQNPLKNIVHVEKQGPTVIPMAHSPN